MKPDKLIEKVKETFEKIPVGAAKKCERCRQESQFRVMCKTESGRSELCYTCAAKEYEKLFGGDQDEKS